MHTFEAETRLKPKVIAAGLGEIKAPSVLTNTDKKIIVVGLSFIGQSCMSGVLNSKGKAFHLHILYLPCEVTAVVFLH